MTKCIVGVDEAGRGPVLGPMVLCAYSIDRKKEAKLKELGVKDSKLLSAARREALLPEILKLGKAFVVVVTALELNDLMKRLSLNDIEAMKVAEALSELKLPKSSEVFIDSPDPVLETFKKRIQQYYKGKAELVCDHKADVKYPVVSAASIVAKVRRDAEIAKIAGEVGEDIGSGYSHDEKTISFLKSHWKDKSHPVHKYARTEWETVKRLKVLQFKLREFM